MAEKVKKYRERVDNILIDDLPFDLDDEDERRALDGMIKNWRTADQTIHRRYWKEWNEIDLRLSGDFAPPGFSTDYTSNMQRRNDPATEDEGIFEYVYVNRARPNHEGLLGDFIQQRKTLIITPSNPRFRNLAKVYQRKVEYILKKAQFWDKIFFPALDASIAKGDHFIQVKYNPFKNMLKGKYEFEEISVRDMLIDSGSYGPNYEHATHRIKQMKFPIEDAKRLFAKYPHFDGEKLSPDTEYDEPYSGVYFDKSPEYQYVTIHYIEFCIERQAFYLATENLDEVNKKMVMDGRESGSDVGDVMEISYQEFLNYNANPYLSKYCFEGEVEKKYYDVLYNTSMGPFLIEAVGCDMSTMVALSNIYSPGRLYHIGDVKIYAALLDLFNVLVSVFLENAKKMNVPIGIMDQDVWENKEMLQAAEYALAYGGPAPGLKKVENVQPVNLALQQLIGFVLTWIQESVSRHPATTGDLPAKQVAKETVQTLIAKDRQAHGRKDIMIRLCLTDIARLLVQMINKYDTENDWIEIESATKGDPDYIPINQMWTEEEFKHQLVDLYGINLPQPDEYSSPEETQAADKQFSMALAAAEKEFRKSNHIQVVKMDGFMIKEQEFTLEDVIGMIRSSGMSPQDFDKVYKPEPLKEPLTRYKINHLGQDIDFNIIFEVDVDYENNKEFRSNRALLEHSKGAISREDLLIKLGEPDAKELVERADAENQVIQLAKQVASDPEMLDFVQKVATMGIEKFMMAVSQSVSQPKQESGSPAPKKG